MMAESLSAYDTLESYKVKLEDCWNAEKSKRRQAERVGPTVPQHLFNHINKVIIL